jgi:hypothetical protein
MAVHRRPSSLRHRTLVALGLVLALAGCGAGKPEQPDDGRICSLYAQGASHVEVLAEGTVVALMGTSSGRSGDHEGFLLKLNKQCDLLLRIEVNTSITGPVPLRPGESVEIKGEYDTDSTGGVIHWTHHDPEGRHVNGYLIAAGKTYR